MNETDIIPAETTPLFIRESFMRAPDWRYQQAMTYLADQDTGKVPRIPTDPCVQYTARALRAFRRPETRDAVELCWDAMYKVIHLGTNAANSAITSEVETLLIQGANTDDPEVKALPFGPEVYTLYEKVFFDLTGIKAIHSWMQDYLFRPQDGRGSYSTRLRARLLAYYGGKDATRRSQGQISANALALMKTMMTNERQCKLFDYVMQHTGLDKVNYAMLMEAALKDMTTREFAEHMKDREEAGSSSMEDIAQGLEAGIRAFSSNDATESGKYGLDFGNQYISHILRTENGKEDIDNG